jgi:hypothetical protein
MRIYVRRFLLNGFLEGRTVDEAVRNISFSRKHIALNRKLLVCLIFSFQD